MATSVVVGLVFQDLARLFAPWVVAVATATMLVSLVRLDVGAFKTYLRRPARAALIIVWTLLLLTGLVYAIVHATPVPPAIGAALILIAATPSIMSVTAYCIFLGTDAALLTLVSIPATALAVLTLPAFAEAIPGNIGGLSFLPLLARTFIVVGVALGGAWLVHRLVPKERIAANGLWLDGAVVILIVFTAFGIVDGLAAVLARDPLKSLIYFLIAFAFNAGLQALTIVAMWKLGPVHAASAGLVGGCRNIALLLGLVLGKVPPDLQLLLVMAQLQLFLILPPTRLAYRALGVRGGQG
jgi:BASS family bile acid:Na+ symporter